jgi:hypothetical protein
MARYEGEQGWERPEYSQYGDRWKTGTKIGETTYADDQYLRKWTLSLGTAAGSSARGIPTGGLGQTGSVLTLTTETEGHDFRCTFKVRHADIETPGTLECRIYNLKDSTAANVIREFDTVTLQAGYIHGHYGVIFEGTIKQFKRGRESAVDSYLDIFAADGDSIWNYAFMNKTLAPGHTQADRQGAITDSLVAQGATKGTMASGGNLGGTQAGVRSVVFYGSALDEAKEHGRTTGTTWSIQNGKVQNLESTAYMRGDIVVVNAGTGMIGVPEVTQEGIFVTTLLNPNVYVKGRVQLDNKSLNNYFAKLPGNQPLAGQQGSEAAPYLSLPRYFARSAEDGIYCILVIDHEGDTRGLPWYTKLTCLNINPDQPFNLASSAGAWSL